MFFLPLVLDIALRVQELLLAIRFRRSLMLLCSETVGWCYLLRRTEPVTDYCVDIIDIMRDNIYISTVI